MNIDGFLGFGSDACAIIDRDGLIAAVNGVWAESAETAGASAGVGVGADYLAVCARAVEAGAPQAQLALKTVSDLLAGRQEKSSFLYPCTMPGGPRWFRADGFAADDTGHVGIRHVDVTTARLAGDLAGDGSPFETASWVMTHTGLRLALADALDGPPFPAVILLVTDLPTPGEAAAAVAAEAVTCISELHAGALARLDDHILAVMITAPDTVTAMSTADTVIHTVGRREESGGARWALVSAATGEDANTVIARGRRSLLHTVDTVDDGEARSAQLQHAAEQLTRAVADFDNALDRGADMTHLRELDSRVQRAEQECVNAATDSGGGPHLH